MENEIIETQTAPVIIFEDNANVSIEDELSRLTSHTEPEINSILQDEAPSEENAKEAEFNHKNVFNEGNPQTLNIGSLLNAEMSIDLLNVILPVLLVYIIKFATGKDASKKQFEATAQEKQIIAPALQNYLNSINFTVESPLNALLITLAVVYGSKTIEVLTDTKKGTLKPDFIAPEVTHRSNPNETRGRHKKGCQCTKCLSKNK